MNTSDSKSYDAYYGTSGTGDADGVYHQDVGSRPLTIGDAALVTSERKAGFLRFNRDASRLYATTLGRDGEGFVKAFRRNTESGALAFLNEGLSSGGGLCHLSLDRSERWLFAVSYGDACISVFRLEADGAIGERTYSGQLEGSGSGVVPDRQESAHAHSIYADPTNRFVFVCDLGMDRIYVFQFDADAGNLTAATIPFVETSVGAGPRHLAFHSNGRWIYAINELDGSIRHYNWDAERGALEPADSVDTLPGDFQGENTTAEILIHPNQRFLYGSNRGHDSIALYAIDPANGSLRLIQRESSGGEHPRNFTLSDDGTLLIVANRDSNNIVYFEIDPEAGRFHPRYTVEGIPASTCVRLVEKGD